MPASFRLILLIPLFFLTVEAQELPVPLINIPPIHAETVDGKKIHLNAPNIITLVLKSNQSLSQRTRHTAELLDDLRGIDQWRLIVVVDFRESIANLLPSIVRMQIRSHLDQEAIRLTPFYRANNNPNNPRLDLHTIADFDGIISEAIGWKNKPQELAAIIFNTKGYIHRRWSDIRNPQSLRKHLLRLLRHNQKRTTRKAPENELEDPDDSDSFSPVNQ